MAELPTTRPSLLVRLRDNRDQDAWRQFVSLYAPVVYSYARKRGLQDADAADLTQDVLRSVASSVGNLDYDPRKGSFSGWLFTLAYRRLFDFQARRRHECQGSGNGASQKMLEALPAPAEDSDLWMQEYDRQRFTWATSVIRPDFHEATWQAFWLTAIEGKSGKEVSTRLDMTVAAVYLAKSRVMARLRVQILQFDEHGVRPAEVVNDPTRVLS